MSKSKKQLSEEKKAMEARKAELMAKKETSELSNEEQTELDNIAVELVDLEEALAGDAKEEAKVEAPAPQEEPGYKVPKGQESCVILQVSRGKKYDENTGKLLTKPFTVVYSYPEWLTFKESYDRLGLEVVEVLHDPYGEAKEMFSNK